MQITIEVSDPSAKESLQKIATAVNADNLKFLAKLAEKPNINTKLSNPLNRAGLISKL